MKTTYLVYFLVLIIINYSLFYLCSKINELRKDKIKINIKFNKTIKINKTTKFNKFYTLIFFFGIFLSKPFIKLANYFSEEIALNILAFNKYLPIKIQVFVCYTLSFFLDLYECHLRYYNFFLGKADVLSIFIGSLAIISAIYIYIIGVSDTLKRHILFNLIKEDALLTISVCLFFLFLIGVSPIFMISGIFYLFYLLIIVVKLVGTVENSIEFQKRYSDYILPILKEQKGISNLKNLYFEIKKNLYISIVENNLIEVEQNVEFLRKTLKKDISIENDKFESNNQIESSQYINSLYSYLVKSPNDDIFNKINYLHIDYSGFYYELGEFDGFYYNLLNTKLVYEYYLSKPLKEREKFELMVISGYKFGLISNIFNSANLKKGSEETLEWISRYYRVLYSLIEASIVNSDRVFFEVFLKLIGYHINEEYDQEKNIDKVYKYFKILGYIGAQLLIMSCEKKGLDDTFDQYKDYIKKMIDESISYLSEEFDYDEGLTVLTVYDYLYSEKVYKKLRWSRFFEPKFNVLDISFYTDKTSDKIDEYFFEIFNERISSENLKNYDCINLFKKYSHRFNTFEDDKKTKNFKELIRESENTLTKDREKSLQEAIIEPEKIEIIKEVIRENLKEAKLTKILKALGIHYEIKKLEGLVTNWLEGSYGINSLENKGHFLNSNIKNIGKDYSKSINNGIEKLFIKGLINDIKIKKINFSKLNKEILSDDYFILICGNYHKFIREMREKDPENIKTKSNLSESYLKEYNNIVEGSYENIPIFTLFGEEKGVYFIKKESIKKVYHELPNTLEKSEEILEYALFSLKQSDEFYKGNFKETLNKGVWLKDLNEEDRENKVKEVVLVRLLQKFKLELRDTDDIIMFQLEIESL